MLKTRLWMGSLLIVFALGITWVDGYLMPAAPMLLLAALLTGFWAAREIVGLLPGPPHRGLATVCVLAVILANWIGPVLLLSSPWPWVLGAAVLGLLGSMLFEACRFREPNGVVVRLAYTYWIVGYLGLLSSYFVQLRWLPGKVSLTALLLAIFIPKMCDTFAYFTGRLIGRHPMTPILSPKKTWEGAVGGLAGAVLTAWVIQTWAGEQAWPLVWWQVVLLGLSVGLAGMVGDLMESMIKRDCQAKDASQAMPGFGGLLDVLDSILFSAPIMYAWAWALGLT